MKSVKLYQTITLALLLMLAACAAPPTPVPPTQAPESTKAAVSTAAPTAVPPTTAPTSVSATKAPVSTVAATVAPTTAAVKRPVVVSLTSEPLMIDNGMTTDLMSAVVGGAVSDALIWYGPGVSYRPALAASWTNPDPKTWRFVLRKGVTFTNGEPFNAAVVKYTAERIMKPENKSPAAATVTRGIQEIKIVDDYTVDILTKDPYPGLLADLAWMTMVPPKHADQVGVQAFGRNPVGLGAMQFVEWVPGDRITLKANPNYWGGVPAADTMVFRPIKEESTAVAALLAGELAIMHGLSPDKAVQVEQNARTTTQAFEGARQVYLALDARNKPFSDVRVRQALNYAVDVDTLIKTMVGGKGIRIRGAFAPLTVGYTPDIPLYTYNVAKAKALLAEAGYANGFNTTLNVTLSGEGIINTLDLAQAIQGYFKAVGVNVDLQIHENAVFWEKYYATKFANGMYIASWGVGQNEGRHLMPLLNSKTRGFYYQSEKADPLLVGCSSTVDPAARKKVCGELEAFLNEDAPWVFLYAQPQLYGVSKSIKWAGTREDFMVHPIEISFQ